jgi:hypothetical protein
MTDGQSASPSWYRAPIWRLRPDNVVCLKIADFLMWGTLSDEREGTIASGPCQICHSWSKSRRVYNHILLSHLRLPQPGGSGSRIYIPQEQGGSVIPPGTGFPLCRLLRFTGLWWPWSPYLRTQSQNQSHVTTDGQSVIVSWFRAHSGAHDHIFIVSNQRLLQPGGSRQSHVATDGQSVGMPWCLVPSCTHDQMCVTV